MESIKSVKDIKINPIEELKFMRITNLRILNHFGRLENEIEQIKEELEILSNEKLLRDILESAEQVKKGDLLDWKDFEKVVEEGNLFQSLLRSL